MAKGSRGTRQGSASNPKGIVNNSVSTTSGGGNGSITARDEKAVYGLLYRMPGNVVGSFTEESLMSGNKEAVSSLVSGYSRALESEFYSFDRDSKVRDREYSEAQEHLTTIEDYLNGGNVSVTEFKKASSRVNTILHKWIYSH